MKKTKVIIPAMGLLLLSTAASITGTVAWFAVNTSVTVTGLQVKAKAEGGIVIAAYSQTSASAASGTPYLSTLTDAVYEAPDASDFKATASVGLEAAELFPTSTATAATWYHATSDDVNNHAAHSAYTTFGSNLKTDGKNYTGAGTELSPYAYDGQYFLYNKYKVKSTNDSDFSLYVSNITVTGETNSAALNNSLRVAIKVGSAGTVKFFAPMYGTSEGGDLKQYNGTAATVNANITKGSGDLASHIQIADSATANNKVSLAGVDMEIWVYYEGEDENCKSINASAITIDTLNLSFTFTTIA